MSDIRSDIRWECEKCGHWHNNGELKCSCCGKYESVAIAKPKHSHYHKDVSRYDTIDVYAVCKIFDVQDTSGCLQHAIKKLLVTGKRGHKDRKTDIQNAIDTLTRLLELESEADDD